MVRRSIVALTALATVALAAPAHAQYNDDNRVGLGVRAGIFMPTDSFIRDSFGDSIFTFGIGGVNARPSAGSLTPEIDFITADKNGNRLFIGSLTYGYEFHFGDDRQATTVPYARVFGGAAYFDYGINTAGGRRSSQRVGLNYGAELGVVFNNRIRLAARYNGFSEQDGFNFNGFNLSATVNLLRF
jgi:hypothetical protein